MYVRTLVCLNVPSATPRLSYRKAKKVMPFFLLTFLTSLLTDIPMPMSSVRGKSPRLTPISPSTTLAFRLKISTSLLQMTILTNCTRLWTLQASRKRGRLFRVSSTSSRASSRRIRWTRPNLDGKPDIGDFTLSSLSPSSSQPRCHLFLIYQKKSSHHFAG